MSSIFLYGRPGSGKTTLACSMTKLGYHVHILDMDRKVHTMHNLQPLIQAGLLTYETPTSKLVEGSMKQRLLLGVDKPLVQQPKGYLEFVDMIDRHQTKPIEGHENTVLVIDSLSRVSEHLKRFLVHSGKIATMQIQSWGYYLSNLEELFMSFYALQPSVYKHCIIIAHAMTEKDELLGAIEIKPMIDGQMKDKASSYIEEAYFCNVEVSKVPNRDPEYQVITRPVQKITQARTSRPLQTVMKADFSELFKDEMKGATA